MKRWKILEYFFLFGGIIFGICGLYLIIPAVLSTKKITATGLFAKPDRRIWLNRVSEEISYIYEIDKKKNIGVDHTSIKKVRQINKNGNMSIWICPIYPRINCFDKKEKTDHSIKIVSLIWCRWSGSNRHGIATTGF